MTVVLLLVNLHSREAMTKNAPMNTLKREPDQWDSYNPRSYLLPGEWAKKQMEDSPRSSARTTHHKSTDLDRALAAERAQHEYWEEWQGVRPGKPVYEDPRQMQNTLLPSAKYGTEGRGYG